MNSIHDPAIPKRTSINELLNPVAAPPPPPPPQYALPPISYMHPMQPMHPPHPHHPYSPSMPPPAAFSLRAASWDHGHAKDSPLPSAMRPRDADPASCRYPPPPMPSHPLYQEPYRAMRSAPLDEAPDYGMDVPNWPPSSEASVAYPPAIPQMYSDERTAAADPHAKSYPPPPHYEQDMSPAPYHPSHAWQPNERASVRLAARATLPPPPPAPVPPRGQPTPPAFYPPHLNAIAFAAVPYAQPPPHPQPPTASASAPKRTIEPPPADEGTPQPKKKQKTAKGKADGAASRRGYNAKKRSEAAQIAAQNAQLMPTVSYAPGDMGEQAAGPILAASGAMTMVADGQPRADGSGPLHPELQFARCMSNRYRAEEFPRCVSCTRRWAGDTCRFQGIRFFLKNDQKQIVGISFVESQKPDSPTLNFPDKWNIPLEPGHLDRTKRTVALALLPTLQQEMKHLELSEIIRRPRESEVRATCDTCMTSIFSTSWMCRLCGREACAECFEQVKELTVDRVGAPEAEIAALQARREKHAHVNPFFLSCTRRNEHQAKDFSPMSRFCRAELAQAIDEMRALVGLAPPGPAAQDGPAAAQDAPETAPAPATSAPPSGEASAQPAPVPGPNFLAANGSAEAAAPTPATPEAAPDLDLARLAHLVNDGRVGAPASSPGASMPSHETLYFSDAELSYDIFRRVWAKGEPLVVTGLLPKFRVQWTPEYFSSKYGTQSCLILECQTDQNRRVTVGEFFSWFGRYEGRRDCWKLKDWPPSTDFRTAFPELYEDFAHATPVPNYVRRDGVLNLASHFPVNAVAPDLGPKMYNAMASFESQGSKGSTRLHMDMADAVNVMLYAAPTPDGHAGCAAWDLFKAEDAGKLRKFLRKKFKGQYQHDPIHSQQFYLDAALRQELLQEFGVKSHRIYQRPGEAVFIPAGCAHQVCNLADCIKVASDFVSPENIERCEMLTREFREQNQSMAWKEDVLQLRTMMWFAWLSCRRQEKDLD